jgi:hypothetical protein
MFKLDAGQGNGHSKFSGREFLISGTGCMQLQVHRIVEQPQNFNVRLTLVGCNAYNTKCLPL